MSASPARRRGGSGGSGRNRPQGKGGGRKPKGSGGRARGGGSPRAKPDRPFWVNEPAERAVRALTGSVRPAPDPTAVVRSLGPPPLGRFGDRAEHYYAAVYQTAQRFAVAMAAANGVTLLDDDLDGEPGA